ncbi:D-arabinose 5-phosphate isomerase [Citrobacter koseri]|nr:D-arabinose 5-phosphate isomerase [Citrobacter koseri]
MSPVLASQAISARKSPRLSPVQERPRSLSTPAEALHGDLGMIESRDVMLFISYSGGAKELDLIIPRLEDKSITLLAMTGKPTSPLGLAAKAVLDISVEREACPMHLAPTSSTVNTLMDGRRAGYGGDAGARFQ